MIHLSTYCVACTLGLWTNRIKPWLSASLDGCIYNPAALHLLGGSTASLSSTLDTDSILHPDFDAAYMPLENKAPFTMRYMNENEIYDYLRETKQSKSWFFIGTRNETTREIEWLPNKKHAYVIQLQGKNPSMVCGFVGFVCRR